MYFQASPIRVKESSGSDSFHPTAYAFLDHSELVLKLSTYLYRTAVAAFGLGFSGICLPAQTAPPAPATVVLQSSYFVDVVRNHPVEGHTHASASAAKPLVFTIRTKPAHGEIALDAAGADRWTYKPAKDFIGIDEFLITATASGDAKTQRVVILVNEPAANRKLYVDAEKGSDKNPGTEAKPFASIQAASNITLPGDTVYIKDGTYNQTSAEAVVLIARSGAPGAWITYRPYPGAHPKLFAKNAWNVVLITGSWIRVQGLEVMGNMQNVSVEAAAKVYDRFASGKEAQTFGPETSFAQTNGFTVRPVDRQKVPREEQIYPRHVEILANKVHDIQGGGISSMESDYITIEDNNIQDVAGRALYACSGISILGSQNTDFETPQYKMSIQNNLVVNARTYVKWIATKAMSDGNGIILDSNRNAQEKGEPYMGHYLVANNVVLGSGGAGIQVFSTDNADVIYNTVYKSSQTPGLDYGQIWVHATSNLRIMNNIMVAGPDGKMNQFFKDNSNVVYDYNVYFGGRKPEMVGPHDILADPMFINIAAGNFKVQPVSPAIDSAVAEFGVKRDFEGKPRPVGNGPDRGAFEAQSKQ
jgi:hypothetical protein